MLAACAPDQRELEQKAVIATCSADADRLLAEHKSLMAAGKAWDAALLLSPCADALRRDDFAAAIREAEINAFSTDAANESLPAVDRLIAIQKLQTHYPQAGARFDVAASYMRDKVSADTRAAAEQIKQRSGVSVGMSEADALNSAWGAPIQRNRTTTAAGTREQIVFGGGRYVYIEAGRVVAVQD